MLEEYRDCFDVPSEADMVIAEAQEKLRDLFNDVTKATCERARNAELDRIVWGYPAVTAAAGRIGGYMPQARILDACCGARMMWFDKDNPDVEFVDNRELHDTLCDGRKLDIVPGTFADFTALPYADNTFYHVVFDPPHFTAAGPESWTAKKYGRLPKDWKPLIHDGFAECMRVLKPNGTLIFKWSEYQIPVREVLEAIGDYKPLYGHKSGKRQQTHWMAFIKDRE